jgi:hypothetical protein
MKIQVALLFLVVLLSELRSPAMAFTVVNPSSTIPLISRTSTTLTATDASRRDVIASTAVMTFMTTLGISLPSMAAERVVWLTEPTDEFKANEVKAMEFKRAQLAIKAEFLKVLERFTTSSTTEDQLVQDLQDLKYLVQKTGGLPLGVKKEELIKIIRRKKAAGFWPTPVEYA